MIKCNEALLCEASWLYLVIAQPRHMTGCLVRILIREPDHGFFGTLDKLRHLMVDFMVTNICWIDETTMFEELLQGGREFAVDFWRNYNIANQASLAVPGVLPLAAEKLGYQLCTQTLCINAVSLWRLSVPHLITGNAPPSSSSSILIWESAPYFKT